MKKQNKLKENKINKQKLLNYSGVKALYELNLDAIIHSQTIQTEEHVIFITWFKKDRLATFPIPPKDIPLLKELKNAKELKTLLEELKEKIKAETNET